MKILSDAICKTCGNPFVVHYQSQKHCVDCSTWIKYKTYKKSPLVCKNCFMPFEKLKGKNDQYCKHPACIKDRKDRIQREYYQRKKKKLKELPVVKLIKEKPFRCDRHVFVKGKCVICEKTIKVQDERGHTTEPDKSF